MEEEKGAFELMQQYRRDRRALLDFMLSGSLLNKVIMPPGAVKLDDVDFARVSVDYVLGCIKQGGMVDLSKAIRDYHDTGVLQKNNAGSAGEFHLITDPESSGSPPKRAPPPVPVSTASRSKSFGSNEVQELTVDDIEDFGDDDTENVRIPRISRSDLNDAADIALKLPSFLTGITDDDLRETAYEILLACAGAAGGLTVPSKDRKRDKRSRLRKKLGRNKNETIGAQEKRAPGMSSLLETIRVQMEISESMDIRTREGLINALTEKGGKRMDTLLIPLELLCCISQAEFSNEEEFRKWQKRQLNMLAEGLIKNPATGLGESESKYNELQVLFAKIEESEALTSSLGEFQRTECLRALRHIAIPLTEKPARGDLAGQVCHWADGYHLNVRLYEKLLHSVFDDFDEGKLAEEVEEILELLKSTWHLLGITETIHYTCYAWVLFRQYVIMGKQGILRNAIEQMKKITLNILRDPQEGLHLKSLQARIYGEEGFQDVSFLHSFLSPIQEWADRQLGDYHLHFAEGSVVVEDIVTITMIVRRLLMEESELPLHPATISDRDQIESYILSSVKNAFSRMLLAVDKSDRMGEHPLAFLAEEAKKLLNKDSTTFMPVLSQTHPQASAISASLLHKLYGNELKPFLDAAEQLTEDIASVCPAADNLEQYILQLIKSACGEETMEIYFGKLVPYQIETISGTLVVRWINAQLGTILAWVERAIQLEKWDPVSPQQRHGSSIIEVYRIVEETVDQFFAIKVPMTSREMNTLFLGVDNAFQVYAKLVTDNLASKEDLIPPVPTLTRYKKETKIKALVKKELFDPKLPDVKKPVDINVLTTTALCVQLNTLHYAISHLSKLEDSIWERWTKKKPYDKLSIGKSMDDTSESFSQKETFDGSRKYINAATDRICEFTGTKFIFYDLRDPLIENLYKPSVSQSRLETLVEPLDEQLNQLCGIIVEPLRDRVVTILLQASIDGLIRVLLDGGPSRLFFPSDGKLLEEDLEILKDFFICGGDGLPRAVVDEHIARLQQVVKLHGCETRELIENLRSPNGSEMQGSGGRAGADGQAPLKILCHRSDSEASKFLKKNYKIPKSSSLVDKFLVRNEQKVATNNFL